MKPDDIGATFGFAERLEDIKTAKKLELNVFRESGYVEEGEEEIAYYTKYDTSSRFIVARNPEGLIVGVLRVIHASNNGFQTLNDFEIEPGWRARNWHSDSVEIGTVAVEKSFRGGRAQFAYSLGLYRLAVLHTYELGRRYILASVDERLLAMFRTFLHFLYSPLGPSRYYMGSNTVPVVFDLVEWSAYLKKRDPELWSYFHE